MKQILVLLPLICGCLLSGCETDDPSATALRPAKTADTKQVVSAHPTLETLGYVIDHGTESGRAVRIYRHGELVWSLERMMVSAHDEVRDLTRNGLPNLLVSYARSRSFRGYLLLEFTPEGVTELWGMEAHATEIGSLENDIFKRMSAGESLERPPSHPRGPTDPEAFLRRDEPTVIPTSEELEPTPPMDSGADGLHQTLEAMGYRILSGEEAVAVERTFSLLQQGEEVWGLRASIVTRYELRTGQEPGHLELEVTAREFRRSVTTYLLELTPDGVEVLSQGTDDASGRSPPSN